jgi:cellobiose-specific phosphotransferase system component IIA
LNIYKNFADAEYYKALSLARLEKKEEAMKMFKQAGIDFREGHTINEDNAYYEKYPYQLSDWFFPKEK